ncbi:hypothetical protein ACFOET_18870 [Parapedobacter deserti]|uniref:Uncharacterized protein n=1 Tax=Parapedobacter deserti TaxID=1912957 RepID=A0ABV7JTS8_9SPHI
MTMLVENDKVDGQFEAEVKDAAVVSKTATKHDTRARRRGAEDRNESGAVEGRIPKWYNGLLRPSCDGMIWTWTLALVVVSWL